jgi:hypothetical protein
VITPPPANVKDAITMIEFYHCYRISVSSVYQEGLADFYHFLSANRLLHSLTIAVLHHPLPSIPSATFYFNQTSTTTAKPTVAPHPRPHGRHSTLRRLGSAGSLYVRSGARLKHEANKIRDPAQYFEAYGKVQRGFTSGNQNCLAVPHSITHWRNCDGLGPLW